MRKPDFASAKRRAHFSAFVFATRIVYSFSCYGNLEISSFGCTDPFVSHLVRNTGDQFSHVEAHFTHETVSS